MWNYLESIKKPIVLYGTGNAADKILGELEKRNITASGVFASDGFVRDRYFAGFHVMSYADAKKTFGDMTVLLCFGSHIPEVIENIRKIDSEQEMYAPDLPVAGSELFTREYAEKHSDDISITRSMLADDKSRQVLDSIIEYKISGKIKYLTECETEDSENWSLLHIGDNEKYLDIGAYTGDTVKQFLEYSNGCYSEIMALEPDRKNFRKLSEFCSGMDNVTLFNMASGLKNETVRYRKNTGRGTAPDAEGGIEVMTESVDCMLDGKDVSIIKIDVEGSERETIEGAENTILSFRPRMLVATYHRSDDLWKIPFQIKNIRDDYKIYLRKSPCIPAWEINYFFV